MTLNKEFRPIAMVNITNRCTLKCKHCFIYRKGTPNTPTKKNEMPAEQMIKEIKKYRGKYGILRMVWMGGEPLLRKDVLKNGRRIEIKIEASGEKDVIKAYGSPILELTNNKDIVIRKSNFIQLLYSAGSS